MMKVNGLIDPEKFYPPEVVAAAAVEFDKSPMKRRYGDVFTKEVVAVWHQLVDAGKSVAWIGEYNGLIPVTPGTVQKYLDKHKPKPVVIVKPEPETATSAVLSAGVAESVDYKAEPPNLPDFLRRDVLPAVSRPAAGIAALVDLLRDDRVTVRGRVKLDLEIEFGEQ